LGYTPITDHGLALLAAPDSALSALTMLTLQATHITDRGIAHFFADNSPLTSLTELYLHGTVVTPACIAALKQRFPKIKVYN
jgi:hypothetical protein